MPPLASIPPDLTPWHMVAAADWVVKTVMAILVLASVVTWTLLLAKLLELRTAARRLRADLVAALHAPSLAAVAVPGPMRDAAADELERSRGLPAAGTKERVAQRLARVEAAMVRRVGRWIGISRMQTTNLAVVAPGIAEALLATAAGLVAAIPAVVIYNLFARLTAAFRGMAGDLSAATWTLASRDLDRSNLDGRGQVSGLAHQAAAE